MKLFVVIPTVGRKELVSRTLAHLERQTRVPDLVLVSAPDETHVQPFNSDRFDVRFVFGRRGSCAQRNQALDAALPQSDIVTFFDDDFLPASDYLERLEYAFANNPDWAVVMGNAARDGARNAGYTFDEGLAELEHLETAEPRLPISDLATVTDRVGAYGCNMSVRSSAVGTTRFDERLVLYGWQEDIDFTSQLRSRGRIVGLDVIYGVHLGTKSGRVSGLRLGYSQVVNPVYLIRKGTMPARFAVDLMARNVVANSVKSLWPEPYIDRWGRLRGNVLGLWHVLRGRIEPEYILKL